MYGTPTLNLTMAGLESFDMDYQKHRPSRSISEHPSQPQHNILSPEIIRQQQRESLFEVSRKKGYFKMSCILGI